MLSQQKKIVPLASYKAVGDGDSINMKNFHKAAIVIQIHDLAVADLHVLLYSGATNGSKDSALTFNYWLGGGVAEAASSDVYTHSTSADLTLAHGTYDNYLLIIEIDAAAMDVTNGEEWLTLALTTSTGHFTAFAILEPRFPGVNLTALT